MKRATAIVLSVAAGVLVAAGAVVIWLLLRPSGAEATARAYLDALAAGDPTGAVAVMDVEPADAEQLRLAFGGAIERIEDAVVDGTDEDGDRAMARVSFSLSGQPVTATLPLIQVGAVWLVSDGGLGRIAVTTTIGDAAAVGAVIVPAGKAVPLLPARYEVFAAPVGILEGSTTASVAPGTTASADLEPTLAESATETAGAQVRTYLDSCTVPANAVPQNCGIQVPWAADLASIETVRFAIETAPTLAFGTDLQSFASTDGVLVATVTGVTRDGTAASYTYRSENWAVRGTVIFTGNELVLAVQ